MSLPKIIAIVGPTASGKTDVGIVVARAVDGEVITADSRTLYRGMSIGTAKPKGTIEYGTGGLGEERPLIVDGIPHWGIDLVDPDEAFTAAEFQRYADKKISDILKRGKVPILVGGTGLYISAVIDRPNFSEKPPNPNTRAELALLSDAELLEEIALKDPDAAATIDEKNRRRLERAVEILRESGKTLAEARSHGPKKYDALQIGIDVDREKLYERIDERVSIMVAKGLVNEVRGLKEKYGAEANALTGIGYRQILEFFDGKMPLKDAIARIKFDSHHYAKRQETWFKRDERIQWVKEKREAINLSLSFIQETL
jgi:tRNA dimethylallyltransferase